MKDFIMSALPFVIAGICVIVIVMNSKKNKENYLLEGMTLGMCFGLMIGNLFDGNIALGLSLGMLVGEAIGASVKRKKK